MTIVCPCCGRKILSHASAVCNWCGFKIEDPAYQENADRERDAYLKHIDEHDQESLINLQIQNRYTSEYGIGYQPRNRYGWRPDDFGPITTICAVLAIFCFFVFCIRGIPAISTWRSEGIDAFVTVEGRRHQFGQSPVRTELKIAGMSLAGLVIFTIGGIGASRNDL